jgi:hypothetical protein
MSNNSKLILAITELYNPFIHGYTKLNDPCIYGQYIIHQIINIRDFYSKTYYGIILNLLQFYFDYRRRGLNIHPVIKNYSHVLKNLQFINLNIIQINRINENKYEICIKTIWLKLLQRTWRNKLIKRKKNIQILRNPKNLRLREMGLLKLYN